MPRFLLMPFILAPLVLLLTAQAPADDTERLSCGTYRNQGGLSIRVSLIRSEKGIFVTVELDNPRTKDGSWYTVSPEGFEHLKEGYGKAWKAQKEGVIASVKATELNTQKPQPLGIVGSPGKGIVFLGVGQRGQVGVAVPVADRHLTDAIFNSYDQNLVQMKKKKAKPKKAKPTSK